MIAISQQFKNLSLQSKLRISFGLITCVALILTLGLSTANEWSKAREKLAIELGGIANIVAANSTATLAFVDEPAAAETMASLDGHPEISYALLFDKDDRIFARYGSVDELQAGKIAHELDFQNGYQFDGHHLTVIKQVTLEGRYLGYILLHSHLDNLYVQLANELLFSAGIILFALIVTLILASRLQRAITRPVIHLTDLMVRVRKEHLYHLRARPGTGDEIGNLAQVFNEMLAEIQARDDKLAAHQQLLEQKVAERTARLERVNNRLNQYARVYENTLDGVQILDPDWNVLSANSAFTRITGYTEEEVIGRKPQILLSGLYEHAFYETIWGSIHQMGHWRGEVKNRRKNGEFYHEELTISVINDDEGRVINYIAISSDISALKESQLRLEHLAQHDVLTDLPNRLLFGDRIEQAIRVARRKSGQVAVLFVDLDRFKIINDSLGHSIGDLLLKEAANRLQRCVRSADTVARLGGDEFALLLEGVSGVAGPEVVAEKVLTALGAPVSLAGRETFIGCSIGISLYPQDGDDAATLLKNADIAMYRAKQQGGNTFQFFTEDLTSQAAKRLSLDSDLHRAAERGELEIHYQPQFDLRDGSMVGAEALLRWKHSVLGFVSPAEFIPLAEETGFIEELTAWVINTVCRQIRDWQFTEEKVPPIAINISGRHFSRGGLVQMIGDALDRYELQGQALEVEVTEGMFIQQAELAAQTIRELKDLGVSIAIDDFGTGYSSLAYLKTLPLDMLKIDQSFVRDIPEDTNDKAIARAVIALGHSMGLTVIAEGVETEAQEAFLKAEGCGLAQGYHYARPLPVEEFALLLESTPRLEPSIS